ncbi:MAG: putative manganese transporter [Bryobacteraceae bacterium]
MTDVILTSLMITGFVAAMMLLIEYLHVLTGGRLESALMLGQPFRYLLAAGLGALPGCLGAFTAVSLYSHGLLTLGALVTAMIAASGDEAFVMLALMPGTAVQVIGLLAVLGIAVGILTDAVVGSRAGSMPRCGSLVIHPAESIRLFLREDVVAQWKNCSAVRGILVAALAGFAAAVAAGRIGPEDWGWVRVTLLGTAALALGIAATAPDHFLEEHLWRHVLRRHVPRVFLWTLGALAVSGPLSRLMQVQGGGNPWMLLLAAALIGLIPESGPHLVFVTLYMRGAIPFAILLASCIVQDGHGMLPLLAHSRRAFFVVKAVNFAAGLAAGAVALVLSG